MAIWHFGWKQLDESSEGNQLDLKLGGSQNFNFWHKDPQLMWDNGAEEKPFYFKVFEFQKNDFSPILCLRNRQILGFFHCGLNRSLEVRFHFSTPVSESRDQAQPF